LIDLLETQYWSYEKLRSFQTELMRMIVKHAYFNVRGYHKLYNKHGIDINSIKEIEDLEKLPVITKKELQQYNDWVDKKHISTNMRTGGSTGEPLIYHEDNLTKDMRAKKHNRGWIWSGYDQSKDKRAVVCSARGSVGKGKLLLTIQGDVERRNIRRTLDDIRAFQPVQLRSYVSTAYILANWIIDNNYRIEIPSINLIAEQLYPEVRKTIELAFHGKVFEEYVCCDGGSSAWDCERQEGMHETMERAILQSDEEDNMIVTDIWNLASPFIRYKNGDKLFRTDKKCSCGRELPIIKVQGRDNDFIVSKEGLVSPSFLLHHMSHVTKSDGTFIDYKCFQLVQKDNLITVNIVKGDTYGFADEDKLMEVVLEICKGLKVKFNYVDRLEKSISGKIKFIINENVK